MRKLFAFNMVSLDGFFEGPNHSIDWHNVDAEFNEFAIEQIGAVNMLLFGRVTYELMANYWPTPTAIKDDPTVADLMNRLPKLVVSRTLPRAHWHNTRVIKENLAEEISELKQQSGKDIALFGSAKLLSALMQLDLIDEHRIMINPVVLGIGTPLFQGVDHPSRLKLVGSRTFRSGNILLRYQPDRK